MIVLVGRSVGTRRTWCVWEIWPDTWPATDIQIGFHWLARVSLAAWGKTETVSLMCPTVVTDTPYITDFFVCRTFHFHITPSLERKFVEYTGHGTRSNSRTTFGCMTILLDSEGMTRA